ncbi:MAG: PIN domain-containing protein [Actinomycetales bacterium]
MLVFVDSNVWYPIVLADLVLRSVEIGLFDLAWTDEVLAEVERVLIMRKGVPPDSAAAFGAQVRATAPDGRIEPQAYRRLVASMTGPDPTDHVHAAAARAGQADVLLTSNVSDFTAADVGPHCRVLRPADLFSELADTYPIELRRVIVEMAAHRKRPPMTPIDILNRLNVLGLTELVDYLRPSVLPELDGDDGS